MRAESSGNGRATGATGAPDPAPRALKAGLAFRPISARDMSFLAALYRSTREAELALTGWSEAQKAAFAGRQFHAQHAHYMAHYPDAAWLVIERKHAPIGRLYIERWSREHRIIDIALLPAWRGRGLGAAVMRDVIDEAAACGKAVTIHVERMNPALSLYRRLGFREIEDKGVYLLLERPP